MTPYLLLCNLNQIGTEKFTVWEINWVTKCTDLPGGFHDIAQWTVYPPINSR